MSEQIPAGWYPDPQDTISDPRPQRWWDGTGWTASTRPAASSASSASSASDEDTKVLQGEVLQDGPAVRYPELPPVGPDPYGPQPYGPQPYGSAPIRKKVARPVLFAVLAAALGGALVGSGVTYLAMHGRSASAPASAQPGGKPGYRFGGNGGGNGLGGGSNGGGSNGGSSGGGNGGPNGGAGGGSAAGVAVDMVNGISLPVPSGWKGGTTTNGFAALSIGSYTCTGSGGGECSLGGANTGGLKGTDAKQAAQQDIATAAKESYGDIKSHDELKSEAVTVDGRSGYLVRWKVAASQGNDGYVETVVFPSADGKSLVSVHLGFDVDPKAPGLPLMDTIVNGITDFSGGVAGASGGTRT